MTDERRIELLGDALGWALSGEPTHLNVRCWQDVSDYLSAVAYNNFEFDLGHHRARFIKDIVKTLKNEKKNYNLIDIPLKEGLAVIDELKNEELEKFIFQHMKVTETEYTENQEKLSKYYNILKRNNPELKSSNVKLLNECSESKVGLHKKETRNDILERNKNCYTLTAISKYTDDEIKHNITAFNWERIICKNNINGFKHTKYFKTEVVEDLLERGIWKEILKCSWQEYYSISYMNDNRSWTSNGIIKDIKYKDISSSAYSFPPLGLYDGTKYKYSDFYKNFKYNFEKYFNDIPCRIIDYSNTYIRNIYGYNNISRLKTVLRCDNTSKIFTNLLKEDISLKTIETFIFTMLAANSNYDGMLPSKETVKPFVDIYKEFLNYKKEVIEYLQSEEYLSQEKSLDSLKLEEWEEVLNTVKNRE